MTMRKSQLKLVTTDQEAVDLPIRFWDKVIITPGCWQWTGATSGGPHPYGVSWDGTRRVKAHRWAFETANGPLGDGMVPDHLCKNTLCVRPSHMEAVTFAENVRRGDAPGPLAVRTNRCKRGHEFTTDNTLLRRDGGRECRTCKRVHNRATKARAAAKRRAA